MYWQSEYQKEKSWIRYKNCQFLYTKYFKCVILVTFMYNMMSIIGEFWLSNTNNYVLRIRNSTLVCKVQILKKNRFQFDIENNFYLPSLLSASPFSTFRSWTIRLSCKARLGIKPARILRSCSRRACHLKCNNQTYVSDVIVQQLS